eukprot:CAMPEP_0185572230 /NCGR_PEP_ID=MMETSP0434-20130131/4190_1 /TAXON_ID=626734 ORGANISM="Favella taraikaensis, Strain Fe Narragansett Bay" /NCGR_SAMPLE_ID=MMETSP0434 /ASSEMBLY_ACC=CAM_ASM_000379 /LENGTH=64 /DNA_ID=CAMNT_0028188021 /DNA_START=1704 /DNA_END=1894 /DNA_ORIENTATION=+
MKRVFASTEYKVLGLASKSGDSQPVEDEVKVTYSLPGLRLQIAEEEEVFATLEASEPSHIQEMT